MRPRRLAERDELGAGCGKARDRLDAGAKATQGVSKISAHQATRSSTTSSGAERAVAASARRTSLSAPASPAAMASCASASRRPRRCVRLEALAQRAPAPRDRRRHARRPRRRAPQRDEVARRGPSISSAAPLLLRRRGERLDALHERCARRPARSAQQHRGDVARREQRRGKPRREGVRIVDRRRDEIEARGALGHRSRVRAPGLAHANRAAARRGPGMPSPIAAKARSGRLLPSRSGFHWPSAASPFIRARWAKARWAAATFSALPAQAFCGAACSARP